MAASAARRHVASDVSGMGTKVTISNSSVEHNTALGGPNGHGLGGGLTCIAWAGLTVSATTVAHNHVQGGESGAGGHGGDGLGGGFYSNASSTLTLVGADRQL